MTDDNFTKLQNIVGLQLGIDPSKVTRDANFTKELGADSLDQVELVMAIEDAFELDIEDEIAGKIVTVQDVLDYMDGK